MKLGSKIKFGSEVTIIEITDKAKKVLSKFSKSKRPMILNKAVQMSKKTDHPFKVTVVEVFNVITSDAEILDELINILNS